MAGSSKKVIYAALVGNALIAVSKFAGAGITGSSSMLSEGIHSLVDTGNQVLLLLGLRRAKRPANEQFPFGHGKEIYFWGFVVAILIFALGAGLSIYEGIQHIRDPREVTSPMINYIILALSLVFEGAAWGFAFKEFRAVKGDQGYLEAVHQSKDPSMFVVLFEDSAAMLGLLVALGGLLLSQYLGNPIWDGIASVVIGLILAGTAIWLAIETQSLLIGESANKPVRDKVRKIVSEVPQIDAINELLTMHMGPNYILVTLSVDFDDRISAAVVEETVRELSEKIKAALPTVKRVFIEAESMRTAAKEKKPGTPA